MIRIYWLIVALYAAFCVVGIVRSSVKTPMTQGAPK